MPLSVCCLNPDSKLTVFYGVRSVMSFLHFYLGWFFIANVLSTDSLIELPLISDAVKGIISLKRAGTSATEVIFSITLDEDLYSDGHLLWSIRDIPLNYGTGLNCDELKSRPKLHVSKSSQWEIELFEETGREHPASNDSWTFALTNATLDDLVGHSLLLQSPNGATLACTNILPFDDLRLELRSAQFFGPKYFGRVEFFLLQDRIGILVDLHTGPRISVGGKIAWSLAKKWWDTTETEMTMSVCTEASQHTFPQSSISTVMTPNGKQFITIHVNHLDLEDTVLVLFDAENESSTVVDCGELRTVLPIQAGIRIADKFLQMHQRSPFHPTVLKPSLHSLEGIWFLYNSPLSNINKNCTKFLEAKTGNELRNILVSSDQVHAFSMEHSLFGTNSILLSTLVWAAEKISHPYCGLIRPEISSNFLTVVARFFYPISGNVMFSQNSIDPNQLTIVSGKLIHLFHSANTLADWSIRERQANDDSWSTSGLSCENEASIFNPTKISFENCTHVTSTFCPLGSMTAKFGKVPVHAHNGSEGGTFARFSQGGLSLTGPNTIVGKTLQVDIGWAKACATIYPLIPTVAQADLIRYGATRDMQIGTFTVTETLYGQSKVTLSLRSDTKNDEMFNMTMHEGPVDGGRQGSKHPCDEQSVGKMWQRGNNILLSTDSVVATEQRRSWEMDQNLLTGGEFSFLGRSVVLSSKNQLICGTVLPKSDTITSAAVTAIAEFNTTWTSGYIKFIQYPDSNSLISTKTIVTAQMESRSAKLNWGIYSAAKSRDDCAVDIRNLYNPFYLSLKSENYEETCSKSAELCAVGDLSRKAGLISSATAISSRNRHVTTVDFLPLSGPFSVLDMVLSVSDSESSNRAACATINEGITISQKNVVIHKSMKRSTITKLLSEMLGVRTDFITISFSRSLVNNDVCFQFQVTVFASTEKAESILNANDNLYRSPECPLAPDPVHSAEFLPGSLSPKNYAQYCFIMCLGFVSFLLR